MKKAKVILAVFAVVSIMSSCFVRKKDRCPQVGEANYGIEQKK